jgi:hemoglobin
MRTLALALAFAVALPVAVPVAAAADHHEAAPAKSLYERLGGYDALAAVTDDFIGRLGGDQRLGRFFSGHSKDTLTRIRQLVVDQLCAATGGPCAYIGRDMKRTHEGLGITKADWDASVAHFVASLDSFGVPAREKAELLAIVAPLEKDIVDAAATAGSAHH